MNRNIAVVGLGYVGLPLAVCLARRHVVYGFDVNETRIEELRSGVDSTGELTPEELHSVGKNLTLDSCQKVLSSAQIFIVTVPTPVDEFKVPDLRPLLRASELIGEFLKPGDLVVFESTVFPGATEDYCVPVLVDKSGLKYNEEFSVGYSPERINPGDPLRRVDQIVKVVSASNAQALDVIDKLYASVIVAGTHRAPSIKVAEAAKVIENTQRDVNIALINELSQLFSLMDIDTTDVLEAASTKWNFLPFTPGLVGGHCIGVDPYYLTYKGSQLGYHAQMILSGRRINDAMPRYVASSITEKFMSLPNCHELSRDVLCLGATFKEDCPDTRNSKVFELCDELERYGFNISLVDPIAAEHTSGDNASRVILREAPRPDYGVIILAVPHKCFIDIGVSEIRGLGAENAFFADLRNAFPEGYADFKL